HAPNGFILRLFIYTPSPHIVIPTVFKQKLDHPFFFYHLLYGMRIFRSVHSRQARAVPYGIKRLLYLIHIAAKDLLLYIDFDGMVTRQVIKCLGIRKLNIHVTDNGE